MAGKFAYSVEYLYIDFIERFREMVIKSDTIIISYIHQTINRGSVKEGEFRFKWNDDAQWFGVEHVIY